MDLPVRATISELLSSIKVKRPANIDEFLRINVNGGDYYDFS